MEKTLHFTLMDLIGLLNGTQFQDLLLRDSGVALDRALFPLLVRIERFGPMDVRSLANQVGRDHSTVSRHVLKLQSLGLVTLASGADDGRVKLSVVTREGRKAVQAIGKARDRLLDRLLQDWTPEDRDNLVRLTDMLVNTLQNAPKPESH
ncbi:MarR family transcriptional regulator [Kozakia baliensis]|uniref:MarR family winged helix-turn-helix transcriptional regulator n=1 Tax=Kozakia baliensis TaxID=153496 RepID=UPI00345B7E5D